MATQAIATQMPVYSGRFDAASVRERNQALLAAQQRARRGPTPEVFFTKRIDNSRLVTANDPRRAQEMRSFAAAMALLFALIMVYGWQHFSAIEYGYRIEAEKQKINSLSEENRQLRLSEAQLASAERIDVMAHQLGLVSPKPGQVVRPENGLDAGTPVLAQVSPAMLPLSTDRR
jgi:cell division protein FtsL